MAQTLTAFFLDDAHVRTEDDLFALSSCWRVDISWLLLASRVPRDEWGVSCQTYRF